MTTQVACPRSLSGLHIPREDGWGDCKLCGYVPNQLPLARTTDPETSKEAGRWMVTSGQITKDQALALGWIKTHPGCIAGELEEGTKPGIWKRISELYEMGLIRYDGVRKYGRTGRMQRCLYAV